MVDGKDIIEGMISEFPQGFVQDKYYQSECNEDREGVLKALSEGYGLVLVAAHGDAFRFSAGEGSPSFVTIEDIATLGNADRASVFYHTNCSTSAIDYECFNEHLILLPERGAVACLGPARQVFPEYAGLMGREFCRLLFDECIVEAGRAEALQKVPFLGLAGIDHSAVRWNLFAYNLLGDPMLRIWTGNPVSIQVTHSDTVWLGAGSLSVLVERTTGYVPGATVCLYGVGVHSVGLTNSGGEIEFSISPSDTGTMSIVVTGPNFVPYEGEIRVEGPNGGALVLASTVLNDDGVAPSDGDGDGRWDVGEVVEYNLILENVGSSSLEDVGIELRSVPGFSLQMEMEDEVGGADPSLVRIGAGGIVPDSMPFTLDWGAGISPWGKPTIREGDPEYRFGIWLDDSGWHVEYSRIDSTSVAVTRGWRGSATTRGEWVAERGAGLENGDSVCVDADTVRFGGTLGLTDRMDEVAFMTGDTSWVAAVAETVMLGSLAAGAGDTATLTLSSSGSLREIDGASMPYQLRAWNGSGTLLEEVLSIPLYAPSVRHVRHVLDDTTLLGDGDGVPEPGEIVILHVTVENLGGGRASGVGGTLTGVGIGEIDSTDSYGDLDGGESADGDDGYWFTVASPSPALTLTLVDEAGRGATRKLELIPPPPPTGLDYSPGADGLAIWWVPPSDSSVAGYRVLRRSGSGWVEATSTVLRSGAWFVDTGLGAEAGYQYFVTSVDTSLNESAPSETLAARTAVPDLAGWPISAINVFASSPLVADLDGNGIRELVCGSNDARLYCWEPDGSATSGWPFVAGDAVHASPAAGNVIGNDTLEIVAGSDDDSLYVFDGGGAVASGFPKYLGADVRSTPALADLDGDAFLEIVVGSNANKVFAFNGDGTGLVDSTGLFATIGGSVQGSPAIVDLDGDGDNEIVVGAMDGKVYAWYADGTGFKDSTGVYWNLGSTVFGSPVVADLDGDDDPEIICAARNTPLCQSE